MSAQLAPRILFSRIVSAAPAIFLKRMLRINFAGSVPAGQPFVHGASSHNKHELLPLLCENHKHQVVLVDTPSLFLPSCKALLFVWIDFNIFRCILFLFKHLIINRFLLNLNC